MTEYYTDDNGNRVLIRHTGPAGKGFPSGGATGQLLAKSANDNYETVWVDPPDGVDAVTFSGNAPQDGAIALFSGVTGKIIKRANYKISNLATKASLDLKVDKIEGRGLSQNNYTNAEKAKVAAVNTSGYRGTFVNLEAVNNFSFIPTPEDGDYCLVQSLGNNQIRYWWDSSNTNWSSDFQIINFDVDSAALELFPQGDWQESTANVFTDSYRGLVDSHEALINEFQNNASSVEFGGITLLTDPDMVALGFNSQLQITSSGTPYWLPMKNSPWT